MLPAVKNNVNRGTIYTITSTRSHQSLDSRRVRWVILEIWQCLNGHNAWESILMSQASIGYKGKVTDADAIRPPTSKAPRVLGTSTMMSACKDSESEEERGKNRHGVASRWHYVLYIKTDRFCQSCLLFGSSHIYRRARRSAKTYMPHGPRDNLIIVRRTWKIPHSQSIINTSDSMSELEGVKYVAYDLRGDCHRASPRLTPGMVCDGLETAHIAGYKSSSRPDLRRRRSRGREVCSVPQQCAINTMILRNNPEGGRQLIQGWRCFRTNNP